MDCVWVIRIVDIEFIPLLSLLTFILYGLESAIYNCTNTIALAQVLVSNQPSDGIRSGLMI